MALSLRLETRIADTKDCLSNWNFFKDFKELFCTNCCMQIHNDIKQFREKGTVDTEIPPNADQLIKNVLTMKDLESLHVERITHINQIFDIKADIHDANVKLDEYWKLVIEKREVSRQRSIVNAIEYNIQAEIHARENAAKLLQSFLKKRIEKVKSLETASSSSMNKENEIFGPSTPEPSMRSSKVAPIDETITNQSHGIFNSKRKVGDSSQITQSDNNKQMNSSPKSKEDEKWFWPINIFTG